MIVKRKKLAVLIFLIMSMGITACGNKSADTETEADVNTEAETEAEIQGNAADSGTGSAESTASETAQDNGGLTDKEANFNVDKKDYSEFGQKIKDAVAAKDLEALADLTAFPVYLGIDEGSIVETREDFIAIGQDKVFTKELIDSIDKADLEDLGPSMAGFTLMGSETESVPSITFSIVKGSLAVTGINY